MVGACHPNEYAISCARAPILMNPQTIHRHLSKPVVQWAGFRPDRGHTERELGLEAGVGLEMQGGAIRADMSGVPLRKNSAITLSEWIRNLVHTATVQE